MILHERSHWSHFKTAAITVRAPEPRTALVLRARVAMVVDAGTGGRTTLVLEAGDIHAHPPVSVGGTALTYVPPRGGPVPTRGLEPIAVECLAPGDMVVVERLDGQTRLRALRAV